MYIGSCMNINDLIQNVKNISLLYILSTVAWAFRGNYKNPRQVKWWKKCIKVENGPQFSWSETILII